jgi:hypothetical protein
MAKFNTGVSFTDGSTVTGADLNNITSQLNIYTGVISEQTAMAATVSTADQLLIADTDNGDSGAANRVTIQKLLNDTLTNGTYTNANLSGTITSNRTVATSATITTGTIPNLTSSTANITLGTIPTLTAGTTTSTAANITNGTVQTLTASTANITTGTVATLNSTTGTITGLRSTTGTVATLNSTTGTITNLSTTLAGDFTISQGTGTLSTTGATAGTYGTTGIIPTISVDAKGRITTIGTSLGGKILQVVESSSTTPTTVASVTLTDTGLSGTITPTSSSSNILVMVYQNAISTRGANAQGHATTIVRTIGTTSTSITTLNQGYESAYLAAGGATTTGIGGITSTVKLDSPGTTSLCTYKTQGRAFFVTNSGQVIFQDGNSNSRMILMEVAA